MLTLEQIMAEAIWVAKMQGWRQTGTYEELKDLAASEECRDFDLCCEQPKHLQPFFDALWAYEEDHGWMTIQDFYNEVWSKQEQEEPEEEHEEPEEEPEEPEDLISRKDLLEHLNTKIEFFNGKIDRLIDKILETDDENAIIRFGEYKRNAIAKRDELIAICDYVEEM